MTNWNLIGHEAVVTSLQSALASGRLGQAYFFVGPTGVGKGTLALALASALNCREAGAPCGSCSQCRRIREGIHPDVLDLSLEEGKREISVERIPDLQHDLYLRPFEGKCRVAIIRDAEHLNTFSGNQLLKILEEPPAESMLILTTASEESVLPTLRSRCQRIALQPVPVQQIEEALRDRYSIEPSEAARIAAFAQGCPGVAISAAQDDKSLEHIGGQIEALRTLLSATVAERLLLSGKLAPGDTQREKIQEQLRAWSLWWRDVLLVQNGCEDSIVYAHEELAYREVASLLTPRDVHHSLAALQRAQRQLDQNANPRLVLDVLFLNLPSLKSTAAV